MTGASNSMPLDPPPAASGSSQLESDAGNRAGRALILVVERDPQVRDLESYFLNEASFAVEFAADGVAALAPTPSS